MKSTSRKPSVKHAARKPGARPKPKAKAKPKPDAEPLSPYARGRLVALVRSVREHEAEAEQHKGARSKVRGELAEIETSIHETAAAQELPAGEVKKTLIALESDRKRKVATLADVEAKLSAAKEGRKGATADIFKFIEDLRDGRDLFEAAGVGRDPKAPAAPGPAPAASSNPEAWRGVSVIVLKEHGVSDALLEKLYAAGLRTLGELADKTGNDYDKIKGIGATGREKISDATVAYFRKHPIPKAAAPANDAKPAGAKSGEPKGEKPAATTPLKGGLESTRNDDELDDAADIEGNVDADDEG